MRVVAEAVAVVSPYWLVAAVYYVAVVYPVLKIRQRRRR